MLTVLVEKLAFLGNWFWFSLRCLLPTLRSFPLVSTWLKPLYDVLIGGWPLALVLGIALGAVTWMHSRALIERTAGTAELLPTVLAAAVLIELAPVGAGLIIAARTGASLGAELAAMRVSEQVDALEMLGISPLNRLIAPRILACVIAVPLVHILVASLAIFSGLAAESVTGHMNSQSYQRAVFAELRFLEVLLAGLKTISFGWLIGTMGCFVGLTAKGGSEGVGQAATQSVVNCSLLVLIADVFLVALIRIVTN
jgi:phospholipid/cholesterol/gamma-HCH transport system permease protein